VTAVRLGYFEDFKSNNTLLLDGDQTGLKQLVEQLRALAAGAVESIAIHSLPFVETHHGVQLVAQGTTDDIGTLQRGPADFQWQRSRSGWEDVTDKVQAVIQGGRCHHYLDAPHDTVTVMVSSGEYDAHWWSNHG
jgi:hypothetical protein